MRIRKEDIPRSVGFYENRPVILKARYIGNRKGICRDLQDIRIYAEEILGYVVEYRNADGTRAKYSYPKIRDLRKEWES